MLIGRTTVRMSVILLLCCWLLSAQVPTAAMVPIWSFQALGARSGWAWGTDGKDQFHLWRMEHDKLTEATLPEGLGKPEYILDPELSF